VYLNVTCRLSRNVSVRYKLLALLFILRNLRNAETAKCDIRKCHIADSTNSGVCWNVDPCRLLEVLQRNYRLNQENNGGTKVPLNVGTLPTDYTASHAARQYYALY